MDDILETTEANGTITISYSVVDGMKTENDDTTSLLGVPKDEGSTDQQPDLELLANQASCNEKLAVLEFIPNRNDVPWMKLGSRMVSIFKSQAQEIDTK